MQDAVIEVITTCIGYAGHAMPREQGEDRSGWMEMVLLVCEHLAVTLVTSGGLLRLLVLLMMVSGILDVLSGDAGRWGWGSRRRSPSSAREESRLHSRTCPSLPAAAAVPANEAEEAEAGRQGGLGGLVGVPVPVVH